MSGASNRRPSTLRDPAPGRFRLIDKVALVYFGFNSLLLLHPNRPDNWSAILVLHLVYLIGIPLLVRYSVRSPVLSFLREWYPLLGITFMYGELQFLNRVLSTAYHDPAIMALEERIFGREMAVALRQMIPYRPVSEAVHFGYFAYYLTLPSLFIPLWLTRRYREFRISMAVVASVYFFCYLWYIYWPVTGPWWQLARPEATNWFFPRLTEAIVSSGSSRGSAFPSSHIGVSVAVLGMARRYFRPTWRILLPVVILLTIGTVYGGFHYAVDAIGGLIVGLSFDAFGPRLVKRVDGGNL